MSNVPAQRTRSFFPDIAEFFSGGPAWMKPLFDSNVMRLEEEAGEGKYELRAEIPGVDPAKDIDISMHDGRMTIKAERTEKHEQAGRSEFNYGSFSRTVTLPKGADEDGVKASYDQGILTISVPVNQEQPHAKRIEIETKSS
jgi:HSP20 family protein